MENIQTGKERGAIENALILVSNLNELSTKPQSFFDDGQSEKQQIVHTC